ncbi:MAG TPA: LytTR family DNA-binding domain-containing protein [Vicinamibacteria bacterium]|jgi:two-component system LytT family response regulator
MSDSPALRVLIADDEPLARLRIEDLLRDEPGIEVVATAEDGIEAIEAIERHRPDVAFLDIQMPGATGLDVVARTGPERMPATVFVTAYDEHAVKAFELAAVDYLVKPFDDERFARALARVKERVRARDVEAATRRLLDALGPAATGGGSAGAAAPAPPAASPASGYAPRIPVESRGQTRFVPVDAIDYITASGPYAELHVGAATHLIRERMQELERRLDPRRFVRIHRSAIVRLDRVESLQQRPGGELALRLRDGQELTVSRSRRREVEARLARAPAPPL